MAEFPQDNSAVIQISKADVFASVRSIEQIKAELARLITPNPNEPWKQPVITVYLFHGIWSEQSLKFLPQFDEMVNNFMNIYGFKVRYLQNKVAEGHLKLAAFDFGISTFPTISVRRRDKSKVNVALQEVNGGSNKAPKKATVRKFVEKVKKEIEEALLSAAETERQGIEEQP